MRGVVGITVWASRREYPRPFRVPGLDPTFNGRYHSDTAGRMYHSSWTYTAPVWRPRDRRVAVRRGARER